MQWSRQTGKWHWPCRPRYLSASSRMLHTLVQTMLCCYHVACRLASMQQQLLMQGSSLSACCIVPCCTRCVGALCVADPAVSAVFTTKVLQGVAHAGD